MDDLLHTHVSTGQGAQLRSRPDRDICFPHGPTFGAAFDALLADAAPAEGANTMSAQNLAPDQTIENELVTVTGDTAEGPDQPLTPHAMAIGEAEVTTPGIQLSATNIAINAQFAEAFPGEAVLRQATENALPMGQTALPTDLPMADEPSLLLGRPMQADEAIQGGPHTNEALLPTDRPVANSITALAADGADEALRSPTSPPPAESRGANPATPANAEGILASDVARPISGVAFDGTATSVQPAASAPLEHAAKAIGVSSVPNADRTLGQTSPTPTLSDDPTRPDLLPTSAVATDRRTPPTAPHILPPCDRADPLAHTMPITQTSTPQAQSPVASASSVGGAARPPTIPASVSTADLPPSASFESAPAGLMRSGAATGEVSIPAPLSTALPQADGRAGQSSVQVQSSFDDAIASPLAAAASRVETALPTQATPVSTPLNTAPTLPAATPPLTVPHSQGQQASTSRDTDILRTGEPSRTGAWTIAPATAATSSFAPPMAAPLAATGISFSAAALDAPLDALPDLDFTLQTTSHSLATTALTPSSPLLGQASSATAQVIAQQIAGALSNRAADTDAPLELALDPPELGRVRMQISEVAGVMTLMIQAERPETADLMRRHLELLAQEFAEAGLDAPSVHVSQDQADRKERPPQEASSDGQTSRTSDRDTTAPHLQAPQTATGGLDLRL